MFPHITVVIDGYILHWSIFQVLFVFLLIPVLPSTCPQSSAFYLECLEIKTAISRSNNRKKQVMLFSSFLSYCLTYLAGKSPSCL